MFEWHWKDRDRVTTTLFVDIVLHIIQNIPPGKVLAVRNSSLFTLSWRRLHVCCMYEVMELSCVSYNRHVIRSDSRKQKRIEIFFTLLGAEFGESWDTQQNESVWERQESQVIKTSLCFLPSAAALGVCLESCVWVTSQPFPRFRKNWAQTWTVLHGGVLTFHKDPKSAATGASVTTHTPLHKAKKCSCVC